MGGMPPVPGSGQYLGWKSCAHRTPPGPVPVRGGHALTVNLDASETSGVVVKMAELARCRNRGGAVFANEGFFSNSSTDSSFELSTASKYSSTISNSSYMHFWRSYVSKIDSKPERTPTRHSSSPAAICRNSFLYKGSICFKSCSPHDWGVSKSQEDLYSFLQAIK